VSAPDAPAERVTAKHAARLLGRSISRVYAMLAAGELQGRRVGPAWRVALAGAIRLLGPDRRGPEQKERS